MYLFDLLSSIGLLPSSERSHYATITLWSLVFFLTIQSSKSIISIGWGTNCSMRGKFKQVLQFWYSTSSKSHKSYDIHIKFYLRSNYTIKNKSCVSVILAKYYNSKVITIFIEKINKEWLENFLLFLFLTKPYPKLF